MDFPKISYETWVERLKKELKTDDLATKSIQIDTDLKANPFFERTGHTASDVRISRPWQIKALFNGQNVTNIDLLKALEHGVQYVEIYNAEAITDIQKLFDQLILDYIHLHLSYAQLENQEHLESVKDYFKSSKSLETNITVSGIAEQQFRYSLSADQDIVQDLTSFCQDVIAWVDEADAAVQRKQRLEQICVIRVLSQDIVREWAIMEAIQILWRHILAGFDEAYIDLDCHAHAMADSNMELEKNYIRLSAQGLTAAVAGYDAIYIEAANAERPDFHNRLSRNIQHLLSMESFIQHSYQGYRGSFQVADLAEKLAKAAWRKIN